MRANAIIPNKQIIRIQDDLLRGYEPRTELLPLGECSGRTLSGDVAAGDDVPGFDRSAVEGLALRAQDTSGATAAAPVMLLLLDADAEIKDRQCVHVLPGTPIPQGADCVADINVSLMLGNDTDKAFIEKPQQAGAGIIPQRSDIRRGQIMLKKGTALAGHHIALLAGMGMSRVPVFAKPSVDILSYGPMLVNMEADTDGMYLRDMVTPMLAAELQYINARPIIHGIVDEAAITDTLRNSSADISIISGNDLSRTLEQLDGIKEVGQMGIQGVSMRIFSLDNRLLLLLPGHPAQSYFFFKLLCQPIIQSMCGARTSFLTVQSSLDSMPTISQTDSYLPVSVHNVDGQYSATPLDIVNCPIADLLKLHGYAFIDSGTQPGDNVVTVIF